MNPQPIFAHPSHNASSQAQQYLVPPPIHSNQYAIRPTSISCKDLTIVLKSFPKHPTKDSYLQWKNQSLLTISTHPIYHTITTRNHLNKIVINPNITHTDNTALFVALTASLGNKLQDYVDVSDHDSADGLLLWTRLDSMVMGEKTPYDAHKLLMQFHSMKRQNNQTIESFGLKFIAHIDTMSYHEIKAGTVKNQALQFLIGVNMPKLYKEQIKDIQSCKSWWKNKTLRQFIDNVAKVYHAELQMGALDNDYVIKDTTSKEKNPSNQNGRNNTQNQCNSNQNTRNNEEAPARVPAHQQPAALKLKAELMNETTEYGKRAVISKWFHQNHASCCFHNHADTHNFLQCYVVERICNETNDIGLLQQIRNELGIQANPRPPPQVQNPYKTNNNNQFQQQHQFQPGQQIQQNQHQPAMQQRQQQHQVQQHNQVINPYNRNSNQQQGRRQTNNRSTNQNYNGQVGNPPNGNINARMIQLINQRVEEATNNRLAEYFLDMQQMNDEAQIQEEEITPEQVESLNNGGEEEMVNDNVTDNNNNDQFTPYLEFNSPPSCHQAQVNIVSTVRKANTTTKFSIYHRDIGKQSLIAAQPTQ